MEMFIFRHSEWSRIYNCTGINVTSIPLEQKNYFVPESWALIILCTIYYFLYIPCMISIWKHFSENVCYKLLFYIGISDLGILWTLGYVQAFYGLYDFDFCSGPIFNYWIGMNISFFWIAESNSDLILAFNRCLDILSPTISDILFSGFRIYIWLSICTLYPIYWVIFMKPVVYSHLHFSWSFDPLLGYREDKDEQFIIRFHAFHDGTVALLSPLIYLVFTISMCIKTRSFGLGQTITRPQKMAFLQVFLISAMNSLACSIYTVLMDFFIPPQWMITVAHFTWFHVHGFPPVIYLALNKTIRHDCRMMFYKVFRRNKIHHLNGITILAQNNIFSGDISNELNGMQSQNN